MTKSALNPFRDVIVSDARKPEPTVPGLNEYPLQALRVRFAGLTEGDAPRLLQAAERALFISSESPGYGKSHLISRLFRETQGKASLIYIYPFQNPQTPFQSLMLALVRELHFPDRENSSSWNRDDPSQLDKLAHAVLAHLVADLIEGAADSFAIDAPPDAAAAMREDPLLAFQRGSNDWGQWLSQQWDTLEKVFEPALARRGLRLRRPDEWLRVLRTYAFAPFDPYIRRICTDWMCGQPFDSAEAVRVGLRAQDAISSDVSPAEVNDNCRERLHDICELACYFRPFIFCFDQTEVYCGSPQLAHAFGTVVATLVNDVRGHLTMVTANQKPWTDRLRPHIEDADLDRISQPPILLEGLNRAQAEELVRLRMRAVDLKDEDAGRFLKGAWFQELFPTEGKQLGARAFLQRCNEQWSGPEPAVDLETLFAERKDKILATPKRHAFEPDTLQWLVEVAANGISGIEVESIQEKYAQVKWETPRGTCLFGFIPGSHWKQWLTVARVSQACGQAAAKPCKFIFFRAPGQPAIPGALWVARDEIERAKASTLQIIPLRLGELAELYAPRDLYADAAQGDIPFSPEEVIAFIQKLLAPYWSRFGAAIPSAGGASAPVRGEEDIPQPGPLADEVRTIVERVRFLSIEELIAALKQPGITREAVLEAAGFCGEIRLHAHPKMTVLQWQGKG